MLALSGYAINENIHENNRIRIYRGRRKQDSKPVIIKALKEEASNPAGISRLIYEYAMTQNFEIDGVVKSLQLEQEGTVFALPPNRQRNRGASVDSRGIVQQGIAERLVLSSNTVKGYVKNIYGKLGANRRVQVAARAKELKLVKE